MAFPGALTFQYSIDGVNQGTNYDYADGGFYGSGQGQVVRIWSNSNPPNCSFSNWSFLGIVPEWEGSEYSRTLTSKPRGSDSTGGRLNCVANFITNTPPPQYYTVTTAASPLGAGITTGDGQYLEHSLCTITATPENGYRFVKWVLSTGGVSNSQSYTFGVEQNTLCTAYFIEKTGLILRSRNSGKILRGRGNSILRDD